MSDQTTHLVELTEIQLLALLVPERLIDQHESWGRAWDQAEAKLRAAFASPVSQPAGEIQRYELAWSNGAFQLVARDDGRWVELEDHTKALAEVEAELRSLRGELATLLGPRKPREGVTANEQWIAAVAEVLERAEKAEAELNAEIERRVSYEFEAEAKLKEVEAERAAELERVDGAERECDRLVEQRDRAEQRAYSLEKERDDFAEDLANQRELAKGNWDEKLASDARADSLEKRLGRLLEAVERLKIGTWGFPTPGEKHLFATAGQITKDSEADLASSLPLTELNSSGEERRWLIQVCDECDDVFENAEDHRHREGVRGLGIDIEVVPADGPALTPAEARELFSLWLACGMRPPEIHESHPLYTGAMKLAEHQPHPEEGEAPAQQSASSLPGVGELLDDDGPILLKLREEIRYEIEAEGLRDEEGEPMFADHVAAVAIADTVSDKVKAALAALPTQQPVLPEETRERLREIADNIGSSPQFIHMDDAAFLRDLAGSKPECPRCGKTECAEEREARLEIAAEIEAEEADETPRWVEVESDGAKMGRRAECSPSEEMAEKYVGWRLIHLAAPIPNRIVEVCVGTDPFCHRFGAVVEVDDDGFELAGETFRNRVLWSDVRGAWRKGREPHPCPHCMEPSTPSEPPECNCSTSIPNAGDYAPYATAGCPIHGKGDQG